MKIRTIISALILAIPFFLSVPAKAQAKKGDKLYGYIVDYSGKKEYGTITVGDWATNQTKIKFTPKGGKKQSYKPNQIKGYAFQETVKDAAGKKIKRWVEYETHKAHRAPSMFASSTVFMHKEVTSGHYELFCYYVEVRTNASKPYEYSFYVKDEAGNFEHVTEENFEEKARELFGDYKAMASRLGQKDFSHKNMDRMVEDYNYWVDNQHDSNEYRVAMKN